MNKLKALALALSATLGIAALPAAQAHEVRHTAYANGRERPGVHAQHHHRPAHRHFHRHAHIHRHH